MRKKSEKKALMVKRKVRLKKRRKRFFLASIIFLSCAIIFATLFYKLYINSKCKNLSYAINYNLTNKSEKDQNLLDIQEVNLVFQDDDSAIVYASGLSKENPNSNINVKAYLKKTSSGVWQLNKTSLLSLKN